MNEKQSLSSLARDAFIKRKGLNLCESKAKPYADIVAKEEDGTEVYYEIKATAMTRREYDSLAQKKVKYFGAATLTEWNLAIRCPEKYTFVLAIMNKENTNEALAFVEYSTEELLSYSTIPPFKINVNIPFFKGKNNRREGPRKSVCAYVGNKPNYSRIKELVNYYLNDLGGTLHLPLE